MPALEFVLRGAGPAFSTHARCRHNQYPMRRLPPLGHALKADSLGRRFWQRKHRRSRFRKTGRSTSRPRSSIRFLSRALRSSWLEAVPREIVGCIAAFKPNWPKPKLRLPCGCQEPDPWDGTRRWLGVPFQYGATSPWRTMRFVPSASPRISSARTKTNSEAAALVGHGLDFPRELVAIDHDREGGSAALRPTETLRSAAERSTWHLDSL